MWLKIDPFDVLLFREGKPFSAGDSFRAKSVFPPTPLPFLGAIRSKILAEKKDISFAQYTEEAAKEDGSLADGIRSLIQTIGRPNDYGRLVARGPFLSQGNPPTAVYFPFPFDLRLPQKGGRRERGVAYLRPQAPAWPGIVANPPELLPLQTKRESEEAAGMMLDAANLSRYLAGETEDLIEYAETSSLWGTETRVGIELSDQHTAAEGKFYSIAFSRLRDDTPDSSLGFLIQVEGLEDVPFPQSGFLTLGGESRGASYKACADETLPKALLQGDLVRRALSGQRRFKLYLAAPAIFHNGWLPDFLHETGQTYQGQIESLTVQLVAAAVEKAIPIGGWNLVKKQPRAMWKAVPAGSVYFFEKIGDPLTDQDLDLLIRNFHGKSLMSSNWPGNTVPEDFQPQHYGQAGFGLTFVGAWAQA